MNESATSRERVAGRLPRPGAPRRSGWVDIARPVALVFLMFACGGGSESEGVAPTTTSRRTGSGAEEAVASQSPKPERSVPAPTSSSGGAVSEAEVVAVASESPKPERSVPDPATRETMVGWWLRHDQSYMIVIDSVDESGRVEVRYLNPRPVNVSKAEAWTEEGILRLLVELTDENYPGNYYELVYRAGDDVWVGVYHHLGNDETYEVYFLRFEGDTGDGES